MSRRAEATSLLGSPAEQAEMAAADAIGHLIHFWGFKRPMGRVWTLIYLSEGPCDAGTLAARLQMSAGSISMTLAELSKWGTIRKTWKQGDRRDFYEAETNIARLVARVLRERELRLVQDIRHTLAAALETLERDEDDSLKFKRERIRRLYDLSKIGERLLAALAAGKQVDPSPIRAISDDRRREGQEAIR